MPSTYSAEQLNRVLSILEKEVDYRGELVAVTRHVAPTIPDALLNVLLHNTEIANHFFLGYDALSEKEVIDFYKNPRLPMSFFGAYQFESGFLLTEDMEIALDDTFDRALDEPELIRDIGRFLPVFRYQGDYIIADLGEQRHGALLTIVDGHIASILAPGIVEHLRDLREGLDQGLYYSDEDGLVYPTSWFQRVGVRAGTMKMDEYGEVEEP